MYVDACECLWMSELKLRFFFDHFPPHFLRKDVLLSPVLTDSTRGQIQMSLLKQHILSFLETASLMGLELTRKAKVAGQQAAGIYPLLSPKN